MAVVTHFSPDNLALLKGIPLLRAANTVEEIGQAHEIGARAITYVSIMDTFVEGSNTGRLPFTEDLAPMLCLDERGRFINTPMDGSWRMARMLVCNNSPLYVEKILEHVEGLLDRGCDGLFIDNVGCPEECYGEGLHVGFARSEIRGAEVYDKSIAKLPVHEHIYPDKSHKYAHKQLLGRIWDAIKARSPENVCILNLGLESDESGFGEEADGIMAESYIFSWAWEGRKLGFPQIRHYADLYAPYLAAGGAVYALPFPVDSRTRVEDYFFAYAAARLSGFFCNIGAESEEDPVLQLLRNDLGEPLAETNWLADHAYRVYERGVIALSGSDEPRSVEISLPQGYPAKLTDLLSGDTTGCGRAVALQLPAQSGRVWVTTPG